MRGINKLAGAYAFLSAALFSQDQQQATEVLMIPAELAYLLQGQDGVLEMSAEELLLVLQQPLVLVAATEDDIKEAIQV
jgi:hypothetical protein